MYNHNKAQQSKNRVPISWDILYIISMTYCVGSLNDIQGWLYWSHDYVQRQTIIGDNNPLDLPEKCVNK